MLFHIVKDYASCSQLKSSLVFTKKYADSCSQLFILYAGVYVQF